MRSCKRVFKAHISALLASIVLQAAGVTCVLAQPIAVDIDPSKTKIQFTLADALHTVHGTFKLKSGHISVNAENKLISGQMIVDAASGRSGNSLRDGRMRQTFLEVERYPDITFSATSIQGNLPAASASVTISGWFAIHGQRHQLAIPMLVKMTRAEIVATGKFAVPYVAWGVKNPSTFLVHVNQEVDIDVTAVGSISAN